MLQWLNALRQVVSLIYDLAGWLKEWRQRAKARTDYSDQIRQEEEKIKREVKVILDRDLSDDDLLRRMQDGKF
jgi:hypothetical protein